MTVRYRRTNVVELASTVFGGLVRISSMKNKNPRALFVNFSSAEIKKIRALDLVDIELGAANVDYRETWYPGAPYEYSVIVAQLDRECANEAEERLSEKLSNSSEDGSTLAQHIKSSFTLVFVGNTKLVGVHNCGLTWLNIEEADHRDKDIGTPRASIAANDPLTDLVASIQPALPLSRYISSPRTQVHQMRPLLSNKSGDVVAGVFNQVIDEDGTRHVRPYALILPWTEDNVEVTRKIIKILPTLRPDLFSKPQADQTWQDNLYEAIPAVLEVQGEISAGNARHQEWLEAQEAKLQSKRSELQYVNQILVADDESFEGDNRLSVNVRLALEFVGFEVRDIDTITKGKRKEDFWVLDKDYFGVCEVSGLRASNPPRKEFLDLSGRMDTYLRKSENIPEGYKSEDIRGLLILNHARMIDPEQRPVLYSGEPDIVEAAEDKRAGLVSTVELRNIVLAVMAGGMTKEEARELLKRPGLVTLAKGRSKGSPDASVAEELAPAK